MRYLLGAILSLQSYSSLAADWHENVFVSASIGTYEVDAGNVVVIGGGADDVLAARPMQACVAIAGQTNRNGRTK